MLARGTIRMFKIRHRALSQAVGDIIEGRFSLYEQTSEVYTEHEHKGQKIKTWTATYTLDVWPEKTSVTVVRKETEPGFYHPLKSLLSVHFQHEDKMYVARTVPQLRKVQEDFVKRFGGTTRHVPVPYRPKP